MHLLFQKISGRWPFLAVGLVLACLWGTLLIQSPATASSEPHAERISYGLTLPNVMAPVIRKEIHKVPSDEQEAYSGGGIELRALWQLFSVQ